MINKHEAMFEFIKQYVPFYLTFNTVLEDIGQTALQSVYSDESVMTYIDGSSDKEYIFAIIQIKQYDTGITDPPINVAEIFDIEVFMDWLNEQNKIGNFPDFGEKCTIYSIENLQNMPNLAGISEQGEAKYMFQCKVNYRQEL